jgi:predicted transcriptional regulator
MAKKKLLMLNLEDDVSKDLAQVISNKSCRKILDYLSQKDEATEGDIAKELNLPISTTNYSIKQLIKAELIVAEEYHYSKKGKEVQHYKLANQFIIIAPKQTKKSDFRRQLKEMLGLFGVSVVGALGIIFSGRIFNNFNNSNVMEKAMITQDVATNMVAKDVPPMGARMMLEDGIQETFMETSQVVVQESYSVFSPELAAIWFFVGALTIIILYLLYLFAKNKFNKNK